MRQILLKKSSKRMGKKGASGGKMIDWGVGILVLVAVLVEVFGSNGLGGPNWTTNAPAIAQTIFPLMVIVGGIYFIAKKR